MNQQIDGQREKNEERKKTTTKTKKTKGKTHKKSKNEKQNKNVEKTKKTKKKQKEGGVFFCWGYHCTPQNPQAITWVILMNTTVLAYSMRKPEVVVDSGEEYFQINVNPTRNTNPTVPLRALFRPSRVM